jgi:1-deoxy-D-xylulose-5-phosphate synthase
MMIMTPRDENECRQMLYTGYHYNQGPSAVRYPRGTGTGATLELLASLPIGKGVVKRTRKSGDTQLRHLLPEAAQVQQAQRHAGRYAFCQTAR